MNDRVNAVVFLSRIFYFIALLWYDNGINSNDNVPQRMG